MKPVVLIKHENHLHCNRIYWVSNMCKPVYSHGSNSLTSVYSDNSGTNFIGAFPVASFEPYSFNAKHSLLKEYINTKKTVLLKDIIAYYNVCDNELWRLFGG
jgi:hypothetical protein